MKKGTAGLVCLALLLCAMTALADAKGQGTAADFEGKWVSFERYGFSLYVPREWNAEDLGNDTHIVGDAAGERQLSVEVRANEGYTLDSIREELSRAGGYSGLCQALYGEITCIGYAYAPGNLLGAITLSKDGRTVVLFKFSPLDAETEALAYQVLSSLTAIGTP